MTSIQGHRRPRREYPSIARFIALCIAPLDSSPLPKSGDKLPDQPAGPLGIKSPVADTLAAATSIPKYSKVDLERIFKAVPEAWAPVPTPAGATRPTQISFAVFFFMNRISFCWQQYK